MIEWGGGIERVICTIFVVFKKWVSRAMPKMAGLEKKLKNWMRHG